MACERQTAGKSTWAVREKNWPSGMARYASVAIAAVAGADSRRTIANRNPAEATKEASETRRSHTTLSPKARYSSADTASTSGNSNAWRPFGPSQVTVGWRRSIPCS